ncbi:MAG: hypothetical protein J5787_01130 [Alphaproteobacteria bacterium]|nr:hypothetical protein [Alphaproteobacteria bacterium]MBO4643916.1 hypothetical protein [Alphaproteobacteria bacterium]
MKKIFLFLSPFCIAACSSFFQNDDIPFYEKAYALPIEAREWAATAPLKDLCQGTKNWRHEHIREAALNEIKARDIDTRQCYYTGMELTP